MSALIDKDEALKRLEETKCNVPSSFLGGIDLAKAVIQKIRPVDAGVSIAGNKVNLCDSCLFSYPVCAALVEDLRFGDGIGNDNICACACYIARGENHD